MVGGDFNMKLNKGERTSEGKYDNEIEEFREIVEDLSLTDLLLMGGKWTWSNMRSIPSCSRINRFLISQDPMMQNDGLIRPVLV